MAMISLKEYAMRHGVSPTATRYKAAHGGFKTAVRIGRDWAIDEDEPCEDRRVKSGKYTNWRKSSKKQTSEENPRVCEKKSVNR